MSSKISIKKDKLNVLFADALYVKIYAEMLNDF